MNSENTEYKKALDYLIKQARDNGKFEILHMVQEALLPQCKVAIMVGPLNELELRLNKVFLEFCKSNQPD